MFIVAAPISGADGSWAEQELPDADVPTVSRRRAFNSLRLWFSCFNCGVLASRASLRLGSMIWGKATPHGCRQSSFSSRPLLLIAAMLEGQPFERQGLLSSLQGEAVQNRDQLDMAALVRIHPRFSCGHQHASWAAGASCPVGKKVTARK